MPLAYFAARPQTRVFGCLCLHVWHRKSRSPSMAWAAFGSPLQKRTDGGWSRGWLGGPRALGPQESARSLVRSRALTGSLGCLRDICGRASNDNLCSPWRLQAYTFCGDQSYGRGSNPRRMGCSSRVAHEATPPLDQPPPSRFEVRPLDLPPVPLVRHNTTGQKRRGQSSTFS